MILKKCKFCVTKHGGNKYCGGILCGLAGCGKCNGVLTYAEAVRLGKYYRQELEVLKNQRQGLNEEIDEIEKNIETLVSFCTQNTEIKGEPKA